MHFKAGLGWWQIQTCSLVIRGGPPGYKRGRGGSELKGNGWEPQNENIGVGVGGGGGRERSENCFEMESILGIQILLFS